MTIMADGSTSVGSIKGLLELDISDYMSNMQRAKTAEDELKTGDKDIRIDANISEAMAKMDDASDKAKELGAKEPSIDVDADIADAMGRLDEVQAKSDEMGAADPDVHVDANIADAQAKLDAVRAKSEQVDEQHITAKVEAQVDKAINEIDAVATAAQAVDGRTARIQVDADTGKAVAQIAAVSEAQADLDLSTARVRAAYERLDAVQSKGVVSQGSLMTAEAALSRVESEHAAAKERLNQVTGQYNVRLLENTAASGANGSAASRQASGNMKAASAIAASESALHGDDAVNRADTAAKRANGSAAESQAGSYRSLTGALMLVAPALVPIAGAAAGAGVSLIAMAAVGVLAVKGISMAMSDGSVTGQQYSADVQSAAKNLTQLERTGAVGFLSGMNTMTGELNAHMPFLSRATATYSRDLGTISGNTVAGVLGLFERMEPVIMSVDQGLVHASQSFRAWGSGSGATEFVSYLLTMLPTVSSSLGSLMGAIGHVVQAFAPIGTVVLEAVKGVSDAIQTIPTPLLTTLAAGAMAAYTAFKAWQLISPIISGVKTALAGMADGASLASMISPIGAVVTAIGLLGAAYMAFSQKSQTAASAQQDFLSVLEQSNGVIDENVRRTAVKKASDEGMVSSAAQVGVSAKDVTDAILSQGDAYDRIKTKVNANVNESRKFSAQNGYNSKSLVSTANASQTLLEKLDGVRKGYSDAASEQKLMAEATQDSTGTMSAQAQILGLSQSQWEALSSAEATASTAAKDYKNALDVLNGQAQSMDQATSALTLQFDTMASTIKQNIEKVGQAQATSMDVNTVYGAKNHQLIQQVVQDAQAKADAIINSEGKSQKSYADARSSLEQSRQKILDVAKANGLNTDQVSAYLDEVMKLPADVTSNIILDDGDATAGLKDLQVKTASLSKDAKHVTITGENKDALDKIAAVTGAKIDKKTGTLTLDKQQYDVALALANGAKIDAKTGQLLGNNSPMFAKLAEANGWQIDPKTGFIYGNNGQYLAVKGQVDALRINSKYGDLFANDHASGVIANVNAQQLHDKTMNIVTNFIENHIMKQSTSTGVLKPGAYTGGGFTGSSFLPGYADGGVFSGEVTGPSSPIKDNVILQNARLHPGEHVLTEADVDAMGGQRAVYAFRSSLHRPQASPSHEAAPSKTGTASMPSMPGTVTLVDADGSLLARVRAIVEDADGRRTTSLVRGLING